MQFYLNFGPVDTKDGLSNGEGAVVPHDQEHDHQVQHAEVQEVVGEGQDTSCQEKRLFDSWWCQNNISKSPTNEIDY